MTIYRLALQNWRCVLLMCVYAVSNGFYMICLNFTSFLIRYQQIRAQNRFLENKNYPNIFYFHAFKKHRNYLAAIKNDMNQFFKGYLFCKIYVKHRKLSCNLMRISRPRGEDQKQYLLVKKKNYGLNKLNKKTK